MLKLLCGLFGWLAAEALVRYLHGIPARQRHH